MNSRDKLLTNNSGYSIKSWFIYNAAIFGFAIISVVLFSMLVDLAIDGKIDSDINALADILLAVSAIWGTASIAKGVGEISEKFSKKKSPDKEEEVNDQ